MAMRIEDLHDLPVGERHPGQPVLSGVTATTSGSVTSTLLILAESVGGRNDRRSRGGSRGGLNHGSEV